MTYYDVLEITPDADAAAIHRAYCVLTYHLLSRLRDERESTQRQINLAAHIRIATDAYASLTAPKVREAYDHGLRLLQQICAACEGSGSHSWNGCELKCPACGGLGKSN